MQNIYIYFLMTWTNVALCSYCISKEISFETFTAQSFWKLCPQSSSCPILNGCNCLPLGSQPAPRLRDRPDVFLSWWYALLRKSASCFFSFIWMRLPRFRTRPTKQHRRDTRLGDFDLSLTRELNFLPDVIQLRICCRFLLQSFLHDSLGATWG